jgi:hypothetical protein
MLAHEIKNPLAGIRGAAQLLKSSARAEDAPLAQLIVDETDRIRRLVDKMEAFSDNAPPVREPVNIHLVLDRIRALVVNGVADGLLLKETYDPSLPSTYGDEDQLIQIFLNLVKNAAEAAHSRGDGRGGRAGGRGAGATPAASGRTEPALVPRRLSDRHALRRAVVGASVPCSCVSARRRPACICNFTHPAAGNPIGKPPRSRDPPSHWASCIRSP